MRLVRFARLKPKCRCVQACVECLSGLAWESPPSGYAAVYASPELKPQQTPVHFAT
jgi:hypothetical protein